MKKILKSTGTWVFFSLLTVLLLTGCGGGGGTSGSLTGTISGTAAKGPVAGATVTAYGLNASGMQGAQLGTAMTDAQGNFSLNVGNHSGAVMLRLTGGHYTDEATGQGMNMYQNSVMTVVLPFMAAGQTVGNIEITPLTSMAQAWAQGMSGGMTQANIALANGAMGQFFDIDDILTTHPMDPLVQGSGAVANQYQRNYGMTLAAMSQEAADLMMPYSSGMVTAMMQDASDGTLDGMMGGNAISMNGMGGMMGGMMMDATAGTGDLANAMSTFIGNTGVNHSGLTVADMQSLMTSLSNSNGTLQTGTATTGTISGTAAKGPVAGATVTAYGLNASGMQGAQLGTAMTDAQGNFSLNVGNHSGAVMLRLTGGHYTDEATGQGMNMYQNSVMTVVLPFMAAGQTVGNIEITPLTSMAQAWAQGMSGGMTQANIALANGAMGQFFDIDDILTTHPMDPLVQGSGAVANQYQRNYGMTLAAMSQEAADLMMPYSSGMVTAMMQDASDGTLDGMMGGNAISMNGMGGMMGGMMMDATAGTGDLANAMSTFIGNTGVNHSGLTVADMQSLMTSLSNSNGTL